MYKQPAGEGLETRKIRILIAEDNVINQRVALGLLHKIGAAADAVANGNEALKALETVRYDLVFMDCQMPELDGYETTELIRNKSSSVLDHNIPIIAMTAHTMQGDREKCIAAGMNDYIPKPITLDALAACLKKWIPSLPDINR
jgi:CheY-like chemotaxis protein